MAETGMRPVRLFESKNHRARWLALAGLLVFLAYASLAVTTRVYGLFSWELKLTLFIQSIRAPLFRYFMIFVSDLGYGWLPFALVGVAGLLLMMAGFRLEGWVCMGGVGLSALLNRALKLLSARPRPDKTLVEVVAENLSASFPSGHVMFFVSFFGFLLFLTLRYVKSRLLGHFFRGLLGVMILSVGLSRVYLGAHWPSDVLAAYLAGTLWLFLMIEVYWGLKGRQA